jgi:hypothetical protein
MKISPSSPSNSEDSSNPEDSEKKSKVNNIFINRILDYYRYYHRIQNYIQKNKYIRFIIIIQLNVLFGISVYYLSKQTSKNMYLMNNHYFRRFRGFS